MFRVSLLPFAFLFSACIPFDSTGSKPENNSSEQIEWFDPIIKPGEYDCQILSEARMSSTHFENEPGGKASAINEPGFWFGLKLRNPDLEIFRLKRFLHQKLPSIIMSWNMVFSQVY